MKVHQVFTIVSPEFHTNSLDILLLTHIMCVNKGALI